MAGTDEPDLYFYFTDHLGSTTYITDREEVAQYVAYTPYGETFKEYRNVTPYKFNGKELDQETGYYYYGARYYDPQAALWFGTDPLASKYPMNSPYVYCNANPVKYVDPDGRWPWENDNIQRARNDASNIGGSVNLVQGEYGIDAQILNNRGEVVNTRYATAGNQKTPLRNFVETLDKGGYSHAGGTTDITTQDVAVATGVIGVITGGMALAAGTSVTGAIVTASGIANSIDDIGTNANGESLVQQCVDSKFGRNLITATKSIVSFAGIRQDINTLIDIKSTVFQGCVSGVDLLNSIVSLYNSLINND